MSLSEPKVGEKTASVKAASRVEMRQQDPKARICNFEEVPFGYNEAEARSEAGRCLVCKNPQCVKGCPVGIDIPGFIKKIADGDLPGAAAVIRDANLLPAVCGRVCPQEEQCEKTCVLGRKGQPVAIGNLERFAADQEREHGQGEIPACKSPVGKKVAVVGSGPAGLTVAMELARNGYEVTVFEALHEPGGVLVYGIPEFRLPKAIVRKEIEVLEKMGVKIVRNFIVGRTATVNELLGERGFDAVFVGTGAGLPSFLHVPGEDNVGVYTANEYLTRSNLMKAYKAGASTPIIHGKRVVTVGGGNVAMDAARTALRLGAEQSIIVYRRGREEMPARKEEIIRAEEEGIQFNLLCNPTGISGTAEGFVKSITCQRMELGEPDASGRRRPVPVKGSEFVIDCDTVIVAIGNKPNPLIPQTTPDIQTSKWGTIVAKPEDGRTSMKFVYAGGDIVTGAATVILAMGAGKIAAKSIMEDLEGI